MNFGDAVRTCLNNYATFSGRARRSEFWYFWLFTVILQIVGGILDNALLGGAGVIGAIISLALLIPGLAVAVRRLHDTGRSGWWILIGLVPLVGMIVLIVWYVSRGEDGPNRFGADPRGALAAPGWGQPADPAAPRAKGGGPRPWER